jgi:phage terminase large subunit-like protein
LSNPTRGGLDRQVAALLGWPFFPWQAHASDVAGEYHRDSKIPIYRTVGIGVARQNGKTTLVCSRIARQLIPPRQTVAYTAQDRGLARMK